MLSLGLNNVEHGPVLRSKECFDDLTYAEACCSDIFGQILSHIVTFHHRIAVFPTLGSNLVGELIITLRDSWGRRSLLPYPLSSTSTNSLALSFPWRPDAHFRGRPGQQGFCRKKHQGLKQ